MDVLYHLMFDRVQHRVRKGIPRLKTGLWVLWWAVHWTYAARVCLFYMGDSSGGPTRRFWHEQVKGLLPDVRTGICTLFGIPTYYLLAMPNFSVWLFGIPDYSRLLAMPHFSVWLFLSSTPEELEASMNPNFSNPQPLHEPTSP